jgi:N-acyl-L-homoserine lactone synthetase
MQEDGQKLQWQIRSPCAQPIDDESEVAGDWLAELWRFRGGALHDDGRRPKFKSPDGRCTDPDQYDHLSYHILVRSDDDLVGCLRISPFAVGPSLAESFFGKEAVKRLLELRQCPRSKTAEVARWLVHPAQRGQSVGRRLLAGGWALLRNLGFTLAVASVGTRSEHDRALRQIGLNDLPDAPVKFCEIYADDLRLMYAIVANPAPNFAPLIDEMAQTLLNH